MILASTLAVAEQTGKSLEISRPVRPWEFVSALGNRAGILGKEGGAFEAWVYPLKIARDFHLRFHVDGTVLPAESLARTLIVRPESTTVVYTGDTFSVSETLFVPVHEAGAVISLAVDTTRPLEIEAAFTRDFQLEWPGSVGDANADWDPAQRAFYFAAESGKFDALVGSPTGTRSEEEYSSNYFSSPQDSLLLGPTANGKDTKTIVIAASFTGRAALTSLYQHLAKDYPELLRGSEAYYADYLARTVSVDLPDTQMESAYDWARISMLQGLVQNPFLGEGLVAGYDTSNEGGRPGFAWFFGRDAEWTSLALDEEGDFSTARNAMDFLGRYQRADGKIPHEISQSASFLDWFKSTPFAFASADATPLFIITIGDYVTKSGDVEFARQKWDNLWRAYEFLQSTCDSQGLAQNVGVGHGWIEGGPLYPSRVELYQASLGVEAVRALSRIAHLVGKEALSQQLAQTFEKQKLVLNKAFWSNEKQIYTYALPGDGVAAKSSSEDRSNNFNNSVAKASDSKTADAQIPIANRRSIDAVSVLATVPMWFQQLDDGQARTMIRKLAGPDQQTDWGMRILSSHDLSYDPGGYHFGVVWPLFTGWASVAEYRYHRPLPAYSNLRSNSLLALDGSLGHVTEVLSGKYYQTLATGSPHQMWSAAMVVNPLLGGLFGLETDASTCHLIFSPHVPAEWDSFSINHVLLGAATLDLHYKKDPSRIQLTIQSSEASSTAERRCSVKFSPALSLRGKVTSVRLDGHATPFHIEENESDQHVAISVPLTGNNVVEIQVKSDFEISVPSTLPALGTTSGGLRVLSEMWDSTRDTLTLQLSGAANKTYEFAAWNASQIASIDGAELVREGGPKAQVRLKLPETAVGVDPRATVVFHFAAR